MTSVVNITDLVVSVPPDVRETLYESPWTCQAVLKSLSPLAQQYILRLLLVDGPVPAEVVEDWPRDKLRHGSHHTAALASLMSLGLYREARIRGQLPGYMLNPTFQKQLRWLVAGGGQAGSEVPERVRSSTPSMEELDAYAHKQWETLQLYLLSGASEPPQLPTWLRQAGGFSAHAQPLQPLNVHRILQSGRLLIGEKHQRRVTDVGFQFLLKSTWQQLWSLVQEYVRDAKEQPGGELSGVLSFLMQLGFRQVGQALPLAGLQQHEMRIAGHMMQLGFLYPFMVDREVYFCPTRLAASLCSGGSSSSATSGSSAMDIEGGHIIVETNYRVYAYTRSPVGKAILDLFTRCDCTLPNLYVGTLNRESVLRALAGGITASDIVAYLSSHPHPERMAKVQARGLPVVPEVVVDQIRLWEMETLRVRDSMAVLYESFESPELYQKAAEFARNQGLLLYNDPEGRKFAAKEEGHDRIKERIRDLKVKLGLMTGAG